MKSFKKKLADTFSTEDCDKAQHDCFAYSENDISAECSALIEMLCVTRERCPFYKPRQNERVGEVDFCAQTYIQDGFLAENAFEV